MKIKNKRFKLSASDFIPKAKSFFRIFDNLYVEASKTMLVTRKIIPVMNPHFLLKSLLFLFNSGAKGHTSFG